MSEIVATKYWTSVLVGSSAAILGVYLFKRFYEKYYKSKFPYIKEKQKDKKTHKEQQQVNKPSLVQEDEELNSRIEQSNSLDKTPDLTKERVELVYSKWFGKRLAKTLLHNHKANVSEEEFANCPTWFKKNLKFDDELRELEPILQDLKDLAIPLFDNLIDQHSKPIENAWQASPDAILASIILLDQIPRNIYRQSPKQFSFDSIALRLAKRAIARGIDLQLHPLERIFIYLPLEHSENIEDQNTCLLLCKELAQDEIVKRDNLVSFIEMVINYAEKHLVIIQRYSRFPYRNALLRRPNTEEEEEFLKTGETFLQ